MLDEPSLGVNIQQRLLQRQNIANQWPIHKLKYSFRACYQPGKKKGKNHQSDLNIKERDHGLRVSKPIRGTQGANFEPSVNREAIFLLSLPVITFSCIFSCSRLSFEHSRIKYEYPMGRGSWLVSRHRQPRKYCYNCK